MAERCLITHRIREHRLVLSLLGRLDSLNAAEAETKIREILNNPDINELTIDAQNLDYISSAGLRVILRIKKRFEKLRIINVKPAVYEILEMTGFTEMIEVEKEYQTVSIEGAEVIGEGANGILYRIDQDRVVKVYKHADALEDIKQERRNARMALVLGIPTAISYDIVKVGDRYGSMFELLNARSFASLLAKEPERFSWCVEQFTDMLKLIHQTAVPEGKLPQMKDTALNWVEFLKDYLDPEDYGKVLRLVQEIPETNYMIHGDYHINNLELQDDEVLIIDMDTLAVGHPVFELGGMFNTFIGFGEMDTAAVSDFLGISFETAVRFLYACAARYLETDDQSRIQQVMDKGRIIGYVRMIRRAIRRGGLEKESQIPVIQLWKKHLHEALERTDTLLF